MRIISKRMGFKSNEAGAGAGWIIDPGSLIRPRNEKQRLTGRIHNAGEYGLDPKYSDQTVLDLSDIPGNLPITEGPQT